MTDANGNDTTLTVRTYDLDTVSVYMAGKRIMGYGPLWLRYTSGECHASADYSPPCPPTRRRCYTGDWQILPAHIVGGVMILKPPGDTDE